MWLHTMLAGQGLVVQDAGTQRWLLQGALCSTAMRYAGFTASAAPTAQAAQPPSQLPNRTTPHLQIVLGAVRQSLLLQHSQQPLSQDLGAVLGHSHVLGGPVPHTRASVHCPSVQHGSPRVRVLIFGQELVATHQAPACKGQASLRIRALWRNSTLWDGCPIGWLSATTETAKQRK